MSARTDPFDAYTVDRSGNRGNWRSSSPLHRTSCWNRWAAWPMPFAAGMKASANAIPIAPMLTTIRASRIRNGAGRGRCSVGPEGSELGMGIPNEDRANRGLWKEVGADLGQPGHVVHVVRK